MSHSGYLISLRLSPSSLQQVNMPYVMIPAFTPGHQPLPVTPDSQLALPIQPIPCKPGERGPPGLSQPCEVALSPTPLPLLLAVDYPVQLLHSPPPPTLKRPTGSGHLQMQVQPQSTSLPQAGVLQGLCFTPLLPSAAGDLSAAEPDSKTQRLRPPQCLQLAQFEDERLPVPHAKSWGHQGLTDQPVQPASG